MSTSGFLRPGSRPGSLDRRQGGGSVSELRFAEHRPGASTRCRSRHRLLPMMLAGVSVRNELVQRLGYLVGDSELAGKIESGLDAQEAILPLTAPEREAILVALDEVPDGLEELRDRLRDLERRGAEGR